MIDELAFAAVPYVDGGRSIDGADCYGFARLVAAAADVRWPLHHDVGVDPAVCAAVIAARKASWVAVPVPATRPGDAVHMWSLVECGGVLRRVGNHVGVITAPGRMMHLGRRGGVKACDLHDRRTRQRILGFYRYVT